MFYWTSFLMVCFFSFVHNVIAAGKVSCFYTSSAHRKDASKLTYDQLMEAVPYCTHLVYGFLGIDEHTHEVKLLNSWMDSELKKFKSWNLVDIESGMQNLQYEFTAKLKFRNPYMKLLLSVGGFLDPKPHSYFKVLETNHSRTIFIKSLISMVEENGFDGADLAWQFPIHQENKTELMHDASVGFVKEHRTMFVYLLKELSTELNRRSRPFTLTVLPHVKADEFIDFDNIKICVDHIHLMTYDYKTPERSPNEADYSAPLYYVKNRNENRNVEQTVDWWIKQNVPARKLLIAIPTFGRSWRIDKRSGWEMKPPVKANGTPETTLEHLSDSDPGTLPYYELCNLLITRDIKNNPRKLKKVTDNEHHSGSYAYRRGDGENEGMWVSFEEPKTAAEKAKFAKTIHLGGVAIVDLSLDDHHGRCKGFRHDKFPILRAAVSGSQ